MGILKNKGDFYRRFRVRVVQEAYIDIDIMGEEDDIIRLMTNQLLEQINRDPQNWRARYERMYPEFVARGTMTLKGIEDIGPALGGMTASERFVLANELRELPEVE